MSAQSVQSAYNPLSKRWYLTAAAYDAYIFNYDQAARALVPVPGVTPGNCPVNRILRETGRKLFPEANPGVTNPMVAVYDEVSFLNGYIDPNAAIFVVYTTDLPYFQPRGMNPTTNLLNAGPPVYTQGSVQATPVGYLSGGFSTLTLYNTGFAQVPYTNASANADVFVNPYLANVFELNITTSESALTGTLTCYLRSPDDPTNDLTPPQGQIMSILFVNSGTNSISAAFSPGSTKGFMSSGPVTLSAGTATTVYFTLNGADAYQLTTGSGGSTLPNGTRTGDYLVWDSGTSSWVVGDTNITLGGLAGLSSQGAYSVAVGYNAGTLNQSTNAIAVGNGAGISTQGAYGLALGSSAGALNQGAYSVAIGYNAGLINQSTNAVAIGANAGLNNQLPNSIVLNATGNELDASTTAGLYIAPVRNDTSVTGGVLHYNTTTNEIVYNESVPANPNPTTYMISVGARWTPYRLPVFKSYDGITWTEATSVIDTKFLWRYSNFFGNAVYNGSIWVGVGFFCINTRYDYATILYSQDGINWKPADYGDATGAYPIFGTSNAWNVAWSGSMWVAVGVGGSGSYGPVVNNIAYSYDGIYWVGLGGSIFGTSDQGGIGIATNGSMWVVVGQGNSNSIGYSYDGINWVGVGDTILTRGYCVAYNGSMWVAGGFGPSQLAYSTDGITWSGAVTNPLTTTVLAIAYNSSIWVATGRVSGSVSIAYSTDGMNWTAVANSSTYLGRGVTAAWNGSVFVIGGRNGSSTADIFVYSTDGINWSVSSSSLPNYGIFGVGVQTTPFVGPAPYLRNSTSVALGQYAGMSLSTNTVSIGNYAGYISQGTNAVAIGANAGKYNQWPSSIVINASGNELDASTNSGLFVAPIRNDNAVTGGLLHYNVSTNELVYNQSVPPTTYMISLGGISAASTVTPVYESYDGITWTRVKSTVNTSIDWGVGNFFGNAVYNGTLWVGVGFFSIKNSFDYATIFYSEDGVNWQPADTGGFPGPYPIFGTTNGNSVAWNGSMWVAVGVGGGGGAPVNNIAYSYDGIYWLGLGGSIFGTAGNGASGIATNGSMWVVVGRGNGNSIGYSYDGINWVGIGNAVLTEGYCVAWNGSIWVAGGFGPSQLAYSTDGITWLAATTPPLPGPIKAIASNGSIWVATGFNNGSVSIAYSTDGMNWTDVPNSATYLSRGLTAAWNGSVFVIGGRNGTSTAQLFVYSTDGINWSVSSSSLPNYYMYGFGVQTNPFVGPAPYLRNSTSVALGQYAGMSLSTNTVSIGNYAGYISQGTNAVAIGANAGKYNQWPSSIVINASGNELDASTNSGLFVAPIRNDNTAQPTLKYNTTTFELVYDTTKTFVIQHPKAESKYLVHACLEGPEAGVYYRGTATIPEHQTSQTIILPDYVDALATEFTIHVTPIFNGTPRLLNVSRIQNNQFQVYGPSGEFDWHVYGKRLNVNVEPDKAAVIVQGQGPYKWIG